MDEHHISRHKLILSDPDDLSDLDVLPPTTVATEIIADQFLSLSIILYLVILLPLPVFECVLQHGD